VAARLDLEIALGPLKAWWGGEGGALPSEVALTVLLDGAACGNGPQACKLRLLARSDTRPPRRPVLFMPQPLPLPVGARIVQLRKAGPAALELRAMSARGGGQRQAGAAEAPAGEAEEEVDEDPGSAGTELEEESEGEEAAVAAEAAGATEEAAAGSSGGAGGGRAAGGSLGPAALDALAGLQEIDLPSPGSPEEAAALAGPAVWDALTHVEAVASALGVGPAEVFALCDAVDARTRAPADARRFVRMELRLLWRAARSGAAGVLLARAWVARLAAAAGAAAGG
jgi:hypothetical protein